MTENRDTMSIVEKLRPASTVDRRWPASARDAALERLLVAAGCAPAPARRSRRRRVLLTAALTTGLVASGVGVAAAGGLLPESFTRPLSFWSTETGGVVDAQLARRVAQAPGPDGTVLSVWSATGPDGTTCIAPLFEPPGDLNRPAPANFHLAGGSCATGEGLGPFGSLGGSADERNVHTIWASAGDAVRGELLFPDGTVQPVLYAEGQFFLWYVANDRVDPPTLVGYDAAGTVVGRAPLPNMIERIPSDTGD